VNDDAISGMDDMQGDLPNDAGEVVADEIQASKEPDRKITKNPQPSDGEVEAMIAGKVRSLTKPRSG
jgi:hypothetical protein